MPAVSKKQQKFFGIVRAIQKGEMAPTTPETAKAAADMKKGDVKKFASTKHKGLPEKKKIEEDRQINKIIKQLRKSVKSHKKQADTLEKKVKTFKELAEASAFSNITIGMKVGQTFQFPSGETITLDNIMGDPSDFPSEVSINLPFGEGPIVVDAPSPNEFGIAGITTNLGASGGGGGGVQTRQPTKSKEEINQELQSSEDFTKEIEADVYMQGRVGDITDITTYDPETYRSPTASISKQYMDDLTSIHKTYFNDLRKVPSINANLGNVGSAYGMGGELAKQVSQHGLGMTKPYITQLIKSTGEQSKYYNEINQKLNKEKNELKRSTNNYSQSEINKRLRFQIRDVEYERNKLEAMRKDLQTIEKAIPIIRSDYEKLRAERDKQVSELEKRDKAARDSFYAKNPSPMRVFGTPPLDNVKSLTGTDGFGGGQGNRTNRRGSAFNKDGSVNLGSKADMTYKDVTDALNAIADKYNKKRDPLYAAIRDRRAGTEAADKIDALNKASEKEEKAVYDAWDQYNKQPNPDLNLPQDVPSEVKKFADKDTLEKVSNGSTTDKSLLQKTISFSNKSSIVNKVTDSALKGPLSKYKAPVKLFLGYLTGTIPENEAHTVLTKDDVEQAWSDLYIDPSSNSLSVDGTMQNVIGGESLSQLSLSADGKKAKLKFGFQPHVNEKEFAQHPDKYSGDFRSIGGLQKNLRKAVLNYLGPYSADLQVGPGFLRPIGGAIASKMTQISKVVDFLTPDDTILGNIKTGRNLKGEIEIDINKLKNGSLNQKQVYDYLINKDNKSNTSGSEGTFDADMNYISPGYEDAQIIPKYQQNRNKLNNQRQQKTKTSDPYDLDPNKRLPNDPTIKIGKVGRGVYDLSKTYNDTGSPDTPLTQPSAPSDSGEAGYNKLKGKVPNLPSWSNLGSGIELPDTPKPPSGALDAQGYNDANDAWTYDEYMKQYAAIQDAYAKQAEPIEIERMKYSPTGYKGVKKTYTPKWAGGRSVEPPSLGDALNVINNKLVKSLDALTKRWEAYNDAVFDAMQRGLASTSPGTGGQMKGGQGGRRLGSTTQRQGGAYNPGNPYGTGLNRSDSSFKKSRKQKGMKESKLSFELIQQFREESNPRIPRKKGQPANSKKHSDLYTDENPKGTIHGLGFKDVATSKASVSKIRNSSRSHAHKIQAAVAMEQRAREMGKTSEAAVYRKYINSMKKKTKKMNEAANPAQQAAIAISMKKKGIKPKNLKEQIQFAQMQQRIRDAKEKRREQQKKSEKLYIDTKKKGVKFYDKKGSGRLKDGKKIYD